MFGISSSYYLNTKWVRFICHACFVFLSLLATACSSQQGTLQSLSNKPYVIESLERVPVHRKNVVDAYQGYLTVTNDSVKQGFAKKRLADLQLEVAELDVLSEESWSPSTAQQQTNSAIEYYLQFLSSNPAMPGNDLVRYQLARGYSIVGEHDKMQIVLVDLVSKHPSSPYVEESLFRLAEVYFSQGKYSAASKWYRRILMRGKSSVFFERALYKNSWCQFKVKKFIAATTNAIKLIDIKYQQGKIGKTGLASNLSETEKKQLDDVVYISILSLSKLSSVKTINTVFSGFGHREYESYLYQELARFYQSKDRHLDAANVYMAYVHNNSLKFIATQFHALALNIYKEKEFSHLILDNITDYVNRFGVSSLFWKYRNPAQHQLINPILKEHIIAIAKYYHANAKDNKRKSYFVAAEKWYRVYLSWYPQDLDAVRYQFLLAELLFEAKQFKLAAQEYNNTAYHYPAHARTEDAAYAAIVSYDELKKITPGHKWGAYQSLAINNAWKFLDSFTDNRNYAMVLTHTMEVLFENKEYERATILATRLLDREDIRDSDYRRSARLVLAHSQYELKLYAEAEQSYLIVHSKMTDDDANYNTITMRLADSIYKHAETLRDQGLYRQAAFQFMQVVNTVPDADIRIQSEYDAAAMFIKVEDWNRAAVILEKYRTLFSKQRNLKHGVIIKLALVYSKTGQRKKAATELLSLAKTGNKKFKKSMLWQAAQMYQLAQLDALAVKTYKQYIQKFPYPLDTAMDAREKIADYYSDINNNSKNQYWLRQIIKIDKLSGQQRTLHTNYLAAKATLALASPKVKRYKKAFITVPIKKSLRIKKKLMKNVVQVYEKAMDYKISTIYTQATYEIAEIYHEFAKAILKSERPKSLNEEQLEEYDLLLEEQAYPFEEKAIAIHLANISRTKSGVYNVGVKNSFKALETLFPVRYVKREKVRSYVQAIY